MYDINFNSMLFPIDVSLTTALVLLNIKALEKSNILNTVSPNSIKSIFYTFVCATTLKSFNEYFKADNTSNIGDFAVDAIIIWPQVLNVWHVENKILPYGAFFSVVLGFMPQYLAKTSTDIAKYITDKDADYETSYIYITFNTAIPAFTRGVTYFKLKQIIGNEPLSALLASSVMASMLDRSETYISMGINIAISSMNAAANKIEFLQFNSLLDKISPNSSTMIAIDFVEYFLRAAQIEKLIEDTENLNTDLNTENMTTSVPVYNINNDEF